MHGIIWLIFFKGTSGRIIYFVFNKSPLIIVMLQVRNLRLREVKSLLKFAQLVSGRAGLHLTAEPKPSSTILACPGPFLIPLALENLPKFGVARVTTLLPSITVDFNPIFSSCIPYDARAHAYGST